MPEHPVSRLDEIKDRWQYFLGDTWSSYDQAITGHGAAFFAPVLHKALMVIRRDGWEPGVGIVVCAVPDTAPLVHKALIAAPEDIKYLLDLLEASGYGQDEIVQGEGEEINTPSD